MNDETLCGLVRFLLSALRDYDLYHKNPEAMRKLAEGKAYGLVNLSTRKVYVQTGLSQEEHNRVLLHELAHVYLESYRHAPYNKEEVTEKEVWRLTKRWLELVYPK